MILARLLLNSALILLSVLIFACVPSTPHRTIAITMDDLPYAGQDIASLPDATRVTTSLIAAFRKRHVSADIFIVGKMVEIQGQEDARRALLGQWMAAGHRLHNHGYSHRRFSIVPTAKYIADVRRGENVVQAIRASRPDRPSYDAFFRAPYNDWGKTNEYHQALLTALADDGVRLAPYTVDHSDWRFNDVYTAALARGDQAEAQRVGQAYLAQLDAAMAFAESLSMETFKREIPQVLIIHANAINAAYLGDTLKQLKARGYRFVTLQKALEDEAYATPCAFFAVSGTSWFHRWREALRLESWENREPGVPDWIRKADSAVTVNQPGPKPPSAPTPSGRTSS